MVRPSFVLPFLKVRSATAPAPIDSEINGDKNSVNAPGVLFKLS